MRPVFVPAELLALLKGGAPAAILKVVGANGTVTSLVRSCAWCDRVWTSGGWQPAPSLRNRPSETSTICSDCVEHLRELNLSR